MGFEVVIGIAGLFLTAACSGIGGAFWLQSRGADKIEQVRAAADTRVDKILAESKERMDLVLSHVQRVEAVVNDIRAELPAKYVLREDHFRLAEKVENLRLEVFRGRGEGHV